MNHAQSRPDFTGLWELNPGKSTMRGPAPKRLLMKIEHQDPNLFQVTPATSVTGSEDRLTFTYETTGNETTHSVGGGTGRGRARWQDAELVIESSMKMGERELHFKDHWSLSSDGQTLTMAHRDDDLSGQISVFEKAVGVDATHI